LPGWQAVADRRAGAWVPSQQADARIWLNGAEFGVRLGQIYVLSPFVKVADRCRSLVSREFRAVIEGELTATGVKREDLAGPCASFSRPTLARCTRCRGKEADVVIFVLGTDPSPGKGAVDWASHTVDLLNVAVSRTRRAFS
jgi:hypothetical protein